MTAEDGTLRYTSGIGEAWEEGMDGQRRSQVSIGSLKPRDGIVQ